MEPFKVCELKDIGEHNVSVMANPSSDCFVKGEDLWVEVDNLASKQGCNIVMVGVKFFNSVREHDDDGFAISLPGGTPLCSSFDGTLQIS